jgi:hypothetical protein
MKSTKLFTKYKIISIPAVIVISIIGFFGTYNVIRKAKDKMETDRIIKEHDNLNLNNVRPSSVSFDELNTLWGSNYKGGRKKREYKDKNKSRRRRP